MHGGLLIKEARKRQGLSQAALAERLGTPQSTVARWERGTIAPSFENVIRAIRASGLELAIDVVDRDPQLERLLDAHLELTPAERLAQNSYMVDLIEDVRRRRAVVHG